MAGEEPMRAIAERERKTTMERLSSGRSDFLGDTYELSEADKAQMAKHFTRAADQLLNALAPGVDGWVDDMLAFVRPWGFDVTSIHVPTAVKYGRTDNLVPPAHGDWLAAHVPNAIVAAHDSAGHTGDDEDVERSFAWIAGEADSL
jgi:pimeloyl-ACP methyl ester carboxylesterase